MYRIYIYIISYSLNNLVDLGHHCCAYLVVFVATFMMLAIQPASMLLPLLLMILKSLKVVDFQQV